MSRVPTVMTACPSRQELDILVSQCGDLGRSGLLGPTSRCCCVAWWPPHPCLSTEEASGRIFGANYRVHRAAAIISIN